MSSFYARMNELVNNKGMCVSTFSNSDGLPNSKNRSCANEMALFGALLLENVTIKTKIELSKISG